jgi:hypothetical protein
MAETMQKIDRINKTLIHFKPILDLAIGEFAGESESDDGNADSDVLTEMTKVIISKAKQEF